jgi:hypothetical protein
MDWSEFKFNMAYRRKKYRKSAEIWRLIPRKFTAVAEKYIHMISEMSLTSRY